MDRDASRLSAGWKIASTGRSAARFVRPQPIYPRLLLIYSMSVSVDGFIADREGAFGWTAPDEELFRFHLAEVRKLGGFLIGRRLYETMLVWETDPSLRDNELGAAFADVWRAIPKVVFSRTLDSSRATPGLRRRRWPRRSLRRSTRPTRTSRLGAPARPRRLSSSALSTSCACSAIRSSSVAARRSSRRSPMTSRWSWSRPGR